jgi:hypothetical protein
LQAESRVQELAAMMGKVSPATINSAIDILDSIQQIKSKM